MIFEVVERYRGSFLPWGRGQGSDRQNKENCKNFILQYPEGAGLDIL
jgi:hypothetical protein